MLSKLFSLFKKQEKEVTILNDDEDVKEAGSIPILIPILVTFLIIIPIIFLSTVGLKINKASLTTKLEKNFSIQSSFNGAKFYLTPRPQTVIENLVLYSMQKDKEFILKAGSFVIKKSFWSLITFNSQAIETLKIKDAIITIKSDKIDKQSVKEEIINFLKLENFLKAEHSYNINIVNVSFKIASDKGEVLDGFGIKDLNIVKRNSFYKLNGQMFIGQTQYDIDFDYQTERNAFSKDNPFTLKMSSPYLSIDVNGKLEGEKENLNLNAKYKIEMKSLKNTIVNLANSNRMLERSLFKIKHDIANIKAEGELSYNLFLKHIINIDGELLQGSESLGKISLETNQENNKEQQINLNLTKVKVSKTNESLTSINGNTFDKGSVYQNIMSYDDNDISFLQNKSSLASLANVVKKNNSTAEVDSKSIIKNRFSITDLLSPNQLNFKTNINTLVRESGESFGSMNLNGSVSVFGVNLDSEINIVNSTEDNKIDNLKITCKGLVNDANQNGRTNLYVTLRGNDVTKPFDTMIDRLSSDVANKVANIFYSLVSKDANLTNTIYDLSFDLKLDKDVTFIDNFKLNFNNTIKSIEAKMQYNTSSDNPNNIYKTLFIKLIGFNLVPKLQDLKMFESFAKQTSLINKILFLKTISGKTDISFECENCNILSVPIDSLRASLSMNKDGIDFTIPKIQSNGIDINAEAEIDISSGTSMLNAKVNINELTMAKGISFEDVFNKNEKYEAIFIPSLNDLSGKISINSNIIDSPNYTFTKSGIKLSLNNGLILLDDFSVHGYRKLSAGVANANSSLIAQKLQDIQSKHLETDIKLEGSISLQNEPIYSLSFALSNILPSTLISAFSKNLSNDIKGAMSINGRVVSSGYGFADFVKNMQTDSKFTIYNTQLDGFDLNSLAIALGKKQSSLPPALSKKIKKNAKPANQPQVIKVQNTDDALNLIQNGTKAVYSKISGDVVFKDQKLVISGGSIDSGIVKGTFNLSLSPFDNFYYSFVGKSVLNAINYKGGSPVALFISFAGYGKNTTEHKNDINLSQVDAYLKAKAAYRK